MRVWLREEVYEVNRKRVMRLMELIGVAAVYPKSGLRGAVGAAKRIYHQQVWPSPRLSASTIWSLTEKLGQQRVWRGARWHSRRT